MELGQYGWGKKARIFQQNTVFLERPAPATSNYGVLNIGDAPFDGISSGCFSGSNQRTGIAVNVISSTSYTLLRYQRQGLNLFTVGGDGTTFIQNDTSGLAQEGALNIGSQFWTGAGQFAGSANGTYLAINAPSSFIGKAIDVQSNGVSKFSVNAFGDTIISGIVYAPLVIQSFATGSSLLYMIESAGQSVKPIRLMDSTQTIEFFSVDPGGNVTATMVTTTKLRGTEALDVAARFL